jgi:hypothetical protein
MGCQEDFMDFRDEVEKVKRSREKRLEEEKGEAPLQKGKR